MPHNFIIRLMPTFMIKINCNSVIRYLFTHLVSFVTAILNACLSWYQTKHLLFSQLSHRSWICCLLLKLHLKKNVRKDNQGNLSNIPSYSTFFKHKFRCIYIFGSLVIDSFYLGSTLTCKHSDIYTAIQAGYETIPGFITVKGVVWEQGALCSALSCEQEASSALPLPLLQGGPTIATTELPRGGAERRSIIIPLLAAVAEPRAKQKRTNGRLQEELARLTNDFF